MKNWIKRTFLGSGRKPRRIPRGLYRGLNLAIDMDVEAALYLGTFEAETTPFLRRFVRTAKSVVDVGAASGELTAWALKQPGIEKVAAFDASQERWPLFWENIRLNGFDGDPRLTAVEGWFLPEDAGLDPSKLLLDQLPEPILIKIDVDGGEAKILSRMKGLLARRHFRLLVETHSRELDVDCRRILDEVGYRCIPIEPAWWRWLIRERRPVGFNQWIAAQPKDRT